MAALLLFGPYKIQHYNSEYFQSVSDTNFQSASVRETSGSSSHTFQRLQSWLLYHAKSLDVSEQSIIEV